MQEKSSATKELPPFNKYAVAEIFIIDDEPIVVETLTYFLRSAGFKRIHGFTDSFDAVAQMRIVRPDVVFTDIRMPKFSGNTVTKIVKDFPHLRNVPIIAITADQSDEASRSIIEDGAVSVMFKPVAKDTLVERTVQAIEQAMERAGITNWSADESSHSDHPSFKLPTETDEERTERRRQTFRT